MERITQQELTRFNTKWIKDGECRLWQSPLDKDGYGTFFFRKKGRRAHRVAYYMAVGGIKDGYVIDHICKNRHCVNPNHLRQITARENTLTNSNSVSAKNALKQLCKNGHILDRKYGKQRYCSTCQSEKTKRLRKKWRAEANSVKC